VGAEAAFAHGKDIMAMSPKSRDFSPERRASSGNLPARWKRRRMRPFLESLERRATPASYTWIGTMGGAWDNPADWLNGLVPKTGTAEIEFVATGAPQTIVLENDDVNFHVDSLTVDGGSYTLIGPAANASQPFTLSNSATISVDNGGSLSFCTPVSLAGAGADSLALDFLGATSEMGTGTLFINNQSNLYKLTGLSQFALDSGTLVLGSSTAMPESLFLSFPAATLLVPSASNPSIGSLEGSGNVRMGDVAGLASATSLSIDTPADQTDTFDGEFIPGPAAAGQVAGGTIKMNGPGSLTVGSIDPSSAGQFQVDVAGGTLDVAKVANAAALSVAAGATFGGPGTSTFSGPATFTAGSELSVTLSGTGAGAFTQLDDSGAGLPGTVDLAGSLLAATVGFSPVPGESFTIISDPNGTIAGQFANAPNGATITPFDSSLPFLVTYNASPAGTFTSVTLTAQPAATNTTIGSSANSSVYGQTVTFKANVTAINGGAVPTGSVQFVIDGSNFGAPVTLVNGSANIGDDSLSVSGSPHAISAVYTPNSANFTGSSSIPPLEQMITPFAFAYTIANASQPYGTAANLPADLGTTISTGVNGQNLVITYASAGDTTTAHAGMYAITGTLSSGTGVISDYAVTLKSGTLTVAPFAFTYTIANAGQTYGTAADLAADLGTTIATGVNGQNLAITYSSTGDTTTAHSGMYAITGALSSGTGVLSDYAVTLKSGTLTVAPFVFTYTIANATQTYGTAANLAAALGTTIATGVNGQNLAITYNSTGDTSTAHAGMYLITGALSSGTGALSDYAVTLASGTLTVNPFAFAFTIATASQTYGTAADLAADLGTTIATGVNGQNLAITYSSTGDTSTAHAGMYAIAGTLSSGTGELTDYAVTLASGTLTANPFAFTYTIANASQTYGTAGDLAADLGTTIATGVNGQNLAITYSSTGDTSTAHAGMYAIAGTLSSGTGELTDYAVTLASGTLTVHPFAFTYTIANDSQTYGTAANLAADLGTTIATGINGQNLAIGYNSTGDSNAAHAGMYAITATLSSGTGELSDYAVTLGSGTLTDNPYVFTYTIADASQTEGSAANLAADLGTTISTGVNGQNLTIVYSSTGNTNSAPAGTYAIIGTLSAGTGELSDYSVTVMSGRLTVSPAPATFVTLICPSHDPSVYGQPVTFDALVTTNNCRTAPLAGTVAFYDGKPGAGGIPIGAPHALSGGQASSTTRALSGNVIHRIYAVFSPSPSGGPAITSQPLSMKVEGASTAVRIALVPISVRGGRLYAVQVQVTTNIPGLVPTGTVSFRKNGGRAQTKTLVNGTAILDTSRSRPVNQAISVTYHASGNDLSTSATQITF
jgi:hypothetical protein